MHVSMYVLRCMYVCMCGSVLQGTVMYVWFVCYVMNDVACVNELAQIKEEMIQKSDFTKLQIMMIYCY